MAARFRLSKKLYYPAGSISLILLPVLCLWYFDRHHVFEQQHMVSMYWVPKSDKYFDMTYLDRNYTHFHITDDEDRNKLELERSKIELRKFLRSKDSRGGIHFHFAGNSRFQQWIKVYDICKTAKGHGFVADESGLWVFNVKIEKTVALENTCMSICGFINTLSPNAEAKRIAAERAAQLHYIHETVKTYILFILLFLVLIFISISKLSKSMWHQYAQ